MEFFLRSIGKMECPSFHIQQTRRGGIYGLRPRLNIRMNKRTKKTKRKPFGRKPLDEYKDITRAEILELKRLTIARAARRTEILLRLAEIWKK